MKSITEHIQESMQIDEKSETIQSLYSDLVSANHEKGDFTKDQVNQIIAKIDRLIKKDQNSKYLKLIGKKINISNEITMEILDWAPKAAYKFLYIKHDLKTPSWSTNDDNGSFLVKSSDKKEPHVVESRFVITKI